MKKSGVFIKTFGCQMNEYDSDKMADLLARSHGLERVDDPAHPARRDGLRSVGAVHLSQ